MRQINYHAVLHGRSTSSSAPGEAASFDVSAAAKHDRIACSEGAEHIALILQASVRNELSFEARVTASRDGALDVTGKIRFGDGEHVLTVAAAGAGWFSRGDGGRA